MNTTEALKITVNAIRTDAVLRADRVNLNRVTFWLSELALGRKHFAESWSHAGTNDIVRTAARITEETYSARQLVELAY